MIDPNYYPVVACVFIIIFGSGYMVYARGKHR